MIIGQTKGTENEFIETHMAGDRLGGHRLMVDPTSFNLRIGGDFR